MIDVKHKCCIKNKCTKNPSFNFPNENKALYCFEHKKDNMIDITSKRCIKDKCIKQPSFNFPGEKFALFCFEHNSSKMLQGCSKKRPDVFFELNKHCVIVEIDENQHNSYEDICECARINEIVNGVGGKSVIIIRYNPDVVKNKGKKLNITQEDRINLLVKTINKQLKKNYNKFIVKIIQLYYNDNYENYKPKKKENITKTVCI
jgi:hypothetical protein